MTISTHMILVSGQPTPNLTPVLDLAIAPQKVVMLVSPDMQQRADWLAEIFKQKGIKVESWTIDDAWSFEHVESRVLEWLAQHEADEVALNATGGTKLMSIAAYQAFQGMDKPIFYVHPERDELIWLHPPKQEHHQLANRIRIPHFIQAHGGQVVNRGPAQVLPEYREFAEDLIRDIDYFANALGALNWYAYSAEPNLRSGELSPEDQDSNALRDLLDRLDTRNVLKLRQNHLVFTSEDARFFANGGWLEQYVFATLNSLKKTIPAIQDTAQSLHIERGNNKHKVRNELDVVFLANNRLHVIECKTKTFKADNSGADTLYKLDSLVDTMGGLQARAMLVTYKALPPYDEQRAKDSRIRVVQGKQLQSLTDHLTQWIQAR